jgi:hypothetical protein
MHLRKGIPCDAHAMHSASSWSDIRMGQVKTEAERIPKGAFPHVNERM